MVRIYNYLALNSLTPEHCDYTKHHLSTNTATHFYIKVRVNTQNKLKWKIKWSLTKATKEEMQLSEATAESIASS